MLQHINKNQLLLVGKARDIQLALASIKRDCVKQQTLQQYLQQRPTMSIMLYLD